MSRLVAVLVLTAALGGCTKRQADFAFFALAVASEVAEVAAAAEAASEQPPPQPDRYAGPTQADLQRAHDVAWELTRIAAHDARIDNCAAVVRTSKHVRVIDVDVFANVFLKDPPIQRCLAITP